MVYMHVSATYFREMELRLRQELYTLHVFH